MTKKERKELDLNPLASGRLDLSVECVLKDEGII